MSETTVTAEVADESTVTVGEFDWESNNMDMKYLTCRVHAGTKYLTKHPWQRTIHVLQDDNKCDCLLSSLIVLAG